MLRPTNLHCGKVYVSTSITICPFLNGRINRGCRYFGSYEPFIPRPRLRAFDASNNRITNLGENSVPHEDYRRVTYPCINWGPPSADVPESRFGRTGTESPTAYSSDVQVKRKRKVVNKGSFVVLSSSYVLPKIRKKARRTAMQQAVQDLMLEEDAGQTVNELSRNPKKVTLEAALEQIKRMQPSRQQVSEKRFKQLARDLERSFTVKQLREYVDQGRLSVNINTPGVSRMTKRGIVDVLLQYIWRVEPSSAVNAEDDFIVENTVPLTKRDLFFIHADSGRLPRSWTETGASIAILSAERKIIVRSTQANFQRINDSLISYLGRVRSAYVSTGVLSKLIPIDQLPLNRIQRFTNTYIEYFARDESLAIFALSNEDINTAKRALVYATGFLPRVTSTQFSTTDNAKLFRVVDDDAMPWNERGLSWHRWKQAIRKGTKSSNVSAFPPELQDTLQSVSSDLVSHLDFNGSRADRATFTALFGFNVVCDSPSQPRQAFLTNVPHVLSKTAGLPLYDDIVHDNSPLSESSPADAVANSPQGDIWKAIATVSGSDGVSPEAARSSWTSILTTVDDPSAPADTSAQASWDALVAVSKKKQQDKRADHYQYRDYTYMAQLQFIPSPFQKLTADELRNYPIVEMWFNVDDNRVCDKNTIQLVAAVREHNAYLPLPGGPVDIKYQGTLVKALDGAQDGVLAFLKEAKLNFGRKGKIDVPPLITINIDGKSVCYMYQCAQYRRSVDLDFHGNLLQLSIVEGGEFAGRRVEASLVLDFPDGPSTVDRSMVSNFVKDAVSFSKLLSVN